MAIENKLTKKLYRRLILRYLFFGSKSSLFILLLYIMWWRILYTITKIGQMKTNIPIFLGISFLLLLMFIHIIVTYRKLVKREINEDLKIVKPVHPNFWKWTVILFSLVTMVGGYYVGSNAVNFNGALAWKIQELKTETRVKLENDNFYAAKLDGILDSVKEKMELEPYLMTNDLKIDFEKDGTITDIYMYVYGFDQDRKLQSGYLIYFDKTKSNKVKIHKQDWHGEGTTVYDPNNDLSIVINMLKWIPVKDEVKRWNEEHYAVMYKGIRNWGIIREGIRYMDEKGKVIPSISAPGNSGPTISLYVPGKEDMITPQRYIYNPFFHEE
ncbi:hypothetical protein [Neobacillus rhizophilus]|uniref:Uncharacterized protein n=1 Tax=Neobacillus rhizophilus TaxID=2833579 RepID=A0A942U901_9BACI|nr:hypothetical protein [Neobacillus rhizophilus]MBS4214793.1 hypothetical protein [Neobacillus rhizophilus]